MRAVGKNGFTLIELLVVTSMVAVFSVVTFVLLNPAELLKQSRDNTRISNMSTLMVVLGAYRAELCPNDIGSSSVTYVSVPDTDPACGNLGLPTLTGGLSYHCAAANSFRQLDGSGWIAVDFTQISSGAPLPSLPIDPLNATSSGAYYTFHPSADGMNWELTSILESNKFASRMAADGGVSDLAYEMGPDLGLAPYTVINRCDPNATSTPSGGGDEGGGETVGVTTTVTQTDDSISNVGFNLSGVAHSQTQVSGSGSGASVILAESSGRPAAPSCSGTNHSGAAWTVTDNDAYDLNAAAGTIEIASDHCNVGAFSIPAGRTVYIKKYAGAQYGQLKVVATSIDIGGTLNGDARGYLGGAGSYDVGISGTNTGSYGGAGGAGGSGGYSGGTSVGSTRGTADGVDIDMGGGAAGGGAGGSGAGYGASSPGLGGNPGGGSAYLYGSGTVSVSGVVSMNGGAGGNGGNGDAGDCGALPGNGGGGGAGGSGGGVLVNGSAVTVSGTLRANGGAGGSGGPAGEQYEYEYCGLGENGTPGASGGGGRLKLFGVSVDSSGATLSVTGNSAGTTSTSAGVSYYLIGTYTSGPIDTGAATVAWRTISWTHSSGQTLALKARSANASDMSGATAWNSCTAIVNGESLATGGCVTAGHRYIQYQATFITANNAITPSLDDVTIIYTR